MPTIFLYLNCIISDPNPSFCPEVIVTECNTGYPDSSTKKKDTYFKRYLWQTALLVPLSTETKVVLDRNFCRFSIICGLKLCHFLTSDQLLSQSYFLYITSASSLCFWYLRSWDSSQVANDDVCTQSSVLFSWNSLGNTMAVRNQTVILVLVLEKRRILL